MYTPFKAETTYDGLVKALKAAYIKTKSSVYARRILATRIQKPAETVAEFARNLRSLAGECKFQHVTADQYKEEMIRDAFVNGVNSPMIRQRLLELSELNLAKALEIASSMENAAQQSILFHPSPNVATTVALATSVKETAETGPPEHENQVQRGDLASLLEDMKVVKETLASVTGGKHYQNKKCFYCGGSVHPRVDCPANNAICNYCNKKGHYSRVCLVRKRGGDKRKDGISASISSSQLSASGSDITVPPSSLRDAVITVVVKG